MGGARARITIKYYTGDYESGKDSALTASIEVLARSIASAMACRAFLSYQPYCKCLKFGPNIGRARNWPSRQPAALYIRVSSFEQWARILVGS